MNSSTVTCPLGCSPQLTSWRADLSSPTPDECKDAKAKWPTLLGIHPWNCYWEWVYANVGPQNNYMHRPLYWASLQFASRGDGLGVKACGPIEWPGRYLMRSVLIAQRDHRQRTKTYFTSEAELTAACKLAAGCNVDDVAYALRTKSTFPNGIQLAVEANATKLRPDCTARPCFRASVVVRVPPSGSFGVYDAHRQGKLLTEWPSGQRPCLFEATNSSKVRSTPSPHSLHLGYALPLRKFLISSISTLRMAPAIVLATLRPKPVQKP